MFHVSLFMVWYGMVSTDTGRSGSIDFEHFLQALAVAVTIAFLFLMMKFVCVRVA